MEAAPDSSAAAALPASADLASTAAAALPASADLDPAAALPASADLDPVAALPANPDLDSMAAADLPGKLAKVSTKSTCSTRMPTEMQSDSGDSMETGVDAKWVKGEIISDAFSCPIWLKPA